MDDKQFILNTRQHYIPIIKGIDKKRIFGFIINKRPTVYLGDIFNVEHLAFPEKLENIKYNSIDELLADGWRVD